MNSNHEHICNDKKMRTSTHQRHMYNVDQCNNEYKLNNIQLNYNLLLEKSSVYTATINELESTICNLKTKIKQLTYKIRKLENDMQNINTTTQNNSIYMWKIYHITPRSNNGGSTTGNVWTTRIFNSIIKDVTLPANDTSVLLLNNTIQIQQGTYDIYVAMNFVNTGSTKIRLFNNTTNSVVDESIESYIGTSFINNHTVSINTVIHLTSTNDFVVQYITELYVANYGLGMAGGIGDYEKFAEIKIKKI